VKSDVVFISLRRHPDILPAFREFERELSIMMNNDVLRSVRYMLNLNNDDMVKIFALTDTAVTAEQIVTWTKKEDEDKFKLCPDILMANFLNGLIYFRRGKDESKPVPKTERKITNNIILKKLRIAFDLKSDDVLEILSSQEFRVSMPEITAMMRAPEHKNFRECGDQFLRYFLRGLTARVQKK